MSQDAPGILSNDDLPAAFWDALPEKADHPDLLAISALKDEESFPQEQAEALKARLPCLSTGDLLQENIRKSKGATGARE